MKEVNIIINRIINIIYYKYNLTKIFIGKYCKDKVKRVIKTRGFGTWENYHPAHYYFYKIGKFKIKTKIPLPDGTYKVRIKYKKRRKFGVLANLVRYDIRRDNIKIYFKGIKWSNKYEKGYIFKSSKKQKRFLAKHGFPIRKNTILKVPGRPITPLVKRGLKREIEKIINDVFKD